MNYRSVHLFLTHFEHSTLEKCVFSPPTSLLYLCIKNQSLMAITLKTDFDTIYLSSHLPEEVSYKTDAASLTIDIYVNSKKVFSSDYYAFEKDVTIRDIRSIVEATMIDERLTFCPLKVVATDPQTATTKTIDTKVVFFLMKTTYGSDGFLREFFLTTRGTILLPRSGQFKVNFFSKANARATTFALIYYEPIDSPGNVLTYEYSFTKVLTTKEKVLTNELSHSYFKKIVDNDKKTDCRVLGVEYEIGERRIDLFFTDEEPTITIKFLSAFNIMETAYLWGTTTTKTEVDRSETVCGHQTSFYDETIKVIHNVETAPLTHDEAMWLNQMLTSRLVLMPTDTYDTVPILITDITSEISDSDKDLVRLKFSWKYADGFEWY